MSDLTMASTNGAISPQSQQDVASVSLNSSAKRKRADNNADAVQVNGNVDVKSDMPTPNATQDSKQKINDLIEVVKRYVSGCHNV